MKHYHRGRPDPVDEASRFLFGLGIFLVCVVGFVMFVVLLALVGWVAGHILTWVFQHLPR